MLGVGQHEPVGVMTRDIKMQEKAIRAGLTVRGLDVQSSECSKHSWAVHDLYELAHENPRLLLRSVLEILSVDSSQETVGALGAGVLEDVLVHHGDECINEIASIASGYPNLKNCLRYTFVDQKDVSESVCAKLAELRDD